jgi:hypothetical protein
MGESQSSNREPKGLPPVLPALRPLLNPTMLLPPSLPPLQQAVEARVGQGYAAAARCAGAGARRERLPLLAEHRRGVA